MWAVARDGKIMDVDEVHLPMAVKMELNLIVK